MAALFDVVNEINRAYGEEENLGIPGEHRERIFQIPSWH